MRARLRDLKPGDRFKMPAENEREAIVDRVAENGPMIRVKIENKSAGKIWWLPFYADPEQDVELIEDEPEGGET